MSVEQNASDNERNIQTLESCNNATTDNNNNNNNSNNEHGHATDVVSPSPLTSPTSPDDPLAILTRGPDYLRARIFQRQSGFERQTPHKSAAESLLESRRLFVRQESESSGVMSMTTYPLNVTTDTTTEEMSSESGLVESMVSKLCIPKTESPDVGGTTASPSSTSHGTNAHASLRTLMIGKRRLCTKADDPYVGQKQRQRLGSADVVVSTELNRLSDADGGGELQWKAMEFGLHPKQRSQSIASKTGSSEVIEKVNRTERSEAEGGSKTYEPPRAVCRLSLAGVESMDVQSEARHLSTVGISEVGHQCDGALCRGAMREVDESEDCSKMDGDEVDSSYKSVLASFPASSEWRDGRGEMVVDSDPRCVLGFDRADDAKGARLFRRYRKVAGKSGSRSDLLNRLTCASSLSEQQQQQLQGNPLASRDSADLDAFFSEMGMDRSAIESALTESQLEQTISTTSLNVFENISSIGTPLDSRSCTSRDSQPMDETMSKSLDLDEPQSGLAVSVVERNARVIRWLCNIRRVSTVTDDGEV